MTQPGTRADWIQHDSEHVHRVKDYLPHLWREMVTPTTAAASSPPPPDGTPPPIAPAVVEQSAQVRLAEAEARFAAELAAVRVESEQWRGHAFAVEAEARAQGYAAGHAEGERQGRGAGEAAVRAEAQQTLTRLATLADDSVVTLRAALKASHETLATLSVAIARAIIGEAFALDPALLARRIVKLLESLSDVTTATVRLHPADLALVQEHWPGLVQTYGWGEQGPRLLGDDAMTPSGCVIEARTHYLDARIETLCELVQTTFATVALPPAPVATDAEDEAAAAIFAPLAAEAA